MKAYFKFYPWKCDLGIEADIRSMFSWINSHPELGKVQRERKERSSLNQFKLFQVDVCINNAGLSTSETLRDGSMKSWRTMLDVNVLGKR